MTIHVIVQHHCPQSIQYVPSVVRKSLLCEYNHLSAIEQHNAPTMSVLSAAPEVLESCVLEGFLVAVFLTVPGL